MFIPTERRNKNSFIFTDLPPTMTKEELEEVFKSYGSLKDVRIVTYRNGHSKGLAYVEFNDEVCNFIVFFFKS
jgi:RNA recognition motif-containing protein